MTKDTKNYPCVYIIVLNWNNRQATLECLNSLRDLQYSNYHVVVVDNSSTDGSAHAVRTSFPDVHLVQTGENLGYAGGNNAGIRFALAQGADYVWLLNNDTVVAPDALHALVKTARADPRIAFAGSKIYFHDQPDRLWYAGATIELEAGGRAVHLGCGQVDTGQFDATTDVGYVTGCSLLASRTAIDVLGPLPEEYFLYFEETDWNVAAHRKGFRTVLAPGSRVWHRYDLAKEHHPRYMYYTSRNRIRLVQKYAPRHVLQAVRLNLSILTSTITTVPPRKKAQLLLVAFLAHLDALRGRFGKAKWAIIQ